MKRTVISLFCAILAVIMVAGCGTAPSSSDAASPAPANSGAAEPAASDSDSGDSQYPLEPVTLKIIMRGEAPNDMDKIVAEMESRMADTINVKLNLVWMTNADISQMSRLSLASGEPNDLVWHPGRTDYTGFVNSGFLLKLDDLVQQYAPTFLADRPAQMIEYSRYKDGLYALPLGVYNKSGHHYNIRDDLRKQLGMEPLETKEDIIEFAYKVKERWPEIPAIVPGAHGQEQFTSWGAFEHVAGIRGDDFIIPTEALSGDLMLYYKNNDGKVYNLFDDPDPKIMASIAEARQLYQDGVIYEDLLSLKTYRDAMAENKAAIVMWGDIIPEPTYVNRLQGVVPDGEIASVFLYDTAPDQILANFKAWNYISIAKVSENPERCLQFLEWTQQNQDIYDLIAYGIEGTHWTDEGEGKYLNTSPDYRWFPYLWIWNPKYDRVIANATDKEFEMEMFLRKGAAEDFVEMWAAPLLFDPEPVQDAFARYTAQQAQFYGPVFNGVVDTESYMAQFRDAAYDDLKLIQEELQRQVDALGDRSYVNE